jgi:replicative DNA helicase Mcm
VVFECSSCSYRVKEVQYEETLTYPDNKCNNCGRNSKWKVIPVGGVYVDSQTIVVQEFPEGMRGGEQPQSVRCLLTEDLCSKYLPGQRVLVSGILKVKQTKKSELVFDTYIETSSIEMKDELYENIEISDEDLTKINALKDTPNLLETISKSIAPTVFGHTEVKKGIALQLFGGVTKTIGKTRIRGDIHVLLIGDPAVAKSVIMKYAADLSARGIFTQGMSSSKAGLTATAIKEEDTWVLEAGALVLADQGLCAVDELDKMNELDRDALHGAMEQQQISVAKAGIIATLLCRCSLLAGANPKLGRFDMGQPLAQQFNLLPTLVSRFDLIYPIMDIPEETRDGEIADHILKTHGTGKVDEGIQPELLKKYIAHAKTFNPKLTPEAISILKSFYTNIRGLANNMHTVPITARSLEALIRLGEATARMRLSNEVTADDARLVINIVDASLRQLAYDSSTRTWDIDRVVSKYPKRMRDIVSRITDSISIKGDEKGVASVKDVVEYIKSHYGGDEREVLATIEVMVEGTQLLKPREGLIKLI